MAETVYNKNANFEGEYKEQSWTFQEFLDNFNFLDINFIVDNGPKRGVVC